LTLKKAGKEGTIMKRNWVFIARVHADGTVTIRLDADYNAIDVKTAEPL
jgi:hypothetical protein